MGHKTQVRYFSLSLLSLVPLIFPSLPSPYLPTLLPMPFSLYTTFLLTNSNGGTGTFMLTKYNSDHCFMEQLSHLFISFSMLIGFYFPLFYIKIESLSE